MKHLCIAAWFAAAGLLVLPAIAAPVPKDEGNGELPAPTEKQLAVSQGKLKQILFAIYHYSSAHNDHLPNNAYSKASKPLLSWRVAILPYIEEEPLYKKFKLDEPWDSDTNKNLIAKLPKLYAPIRVKAKEGETFYRVFTGQGLFGLNAKYTIGDIPDGSSNTGLVFEAGEPVIWTKPDDLEYDAKKPLPKLGGLFDGVCHVGVGDGSVYRLRKNPDEKLMRLLIQPDDGMALDLEAILGK